MKPSEHIIILQSIMRDIPSVRTGSRNAETKRDFLIASQFSGKRNLQPTLHSIRVVYCAICLKEIIWFPLQGTSACLNRKDAQADSNVFSYMVACCRNTSQYHSEETNMDSGTTTFTLIYVCVCTCIIDTYECMCACFCECVYMYIYGCVSICVHMLMHVYVDR